MLQQGPTQKSARKEKRLYTIADVFRQPKGQQRVEKEIQESCSAKESKVHSGIDGEENGDDVCAWVQCGKGSEWFHVECVGLAWMTKEEIEEHEFICNNCK